MLSRRNNLLNDRFAAIAAALTGLEPGTIINGEVVAMDEQGRPSFNLLQHNRGRNSKLFYYAFDVLAYRGKSLLSVPLSNRRELLQTDVLRTINDPVRFSTTLEASAD